MGKEKLLVEAICNGTVLDHVPSEKLFHIVSLLGIDKMSTPVTIGNNLESRQYGSKGIIKMSNRFFSEEELNKIAILAPHVHVNVIRNYDVVDKRTLTLPEQVVGIVRCPNPKCITNAEPMSTRFGVRDDGGLISLHCQYCSRMVESHQVELL